MNVPLRRFFDALNAEERQFILPLVADNLGMILRCAINELDWYYYNMSRSENPTAEQQEQFYLLQIGVARLMKLSLEARPSFDVPTVMFRREREITLPVLEMVSGLGMIEHGRRIAQTVSTGLCRIEQTSGNEFLITLPSVVPDDDYYERAIAEHYRAESRKKFARLLQSERGNKLEADVNKLLKDLVYPFQEHFIGYDADPLLDDYFFGLAFHEVQLYEGYDTFHFSTRFGGIPFQKYVLALTFFISLSIRHERFAEALVDKDPSVKLENVLTISSDTAGFIESIRDAVNHFGAVYDGFEELTLDEARGIFEVLSFSRRNTELLARPASPLPLMVQCSDQGFIRCLTGVRTSPMQFLLDSLRHHFPGDYDRNQQSREKSLQIAIKRVMNDGFAGLEYLENIKIRLDGRELTDIDLVVTEVTTGTVFLCQLKYQDLYGADIHSRHIRTTRLKDQTSRWLASVQDWMGKVGDSGIRASLRLSKSFPLSSIYRVVISKHYGYPLKDIAQDADTAYASWIQFFNSIELLKLETPTDRKLSDLIAMLKRTEAPGGQQEHLAEPRSEWVIRDLKYTVRQED